MTTTTSSLKIPLTRNHRQLANWINEQKLVDSAGRLVSARIERVRTSTDRKIGRLRWPGKGRQGLILEIWLADPPTKLPYAERRLYRHESSETYRRHSEAREWVEKHLRRPRSRGKP